MSSRLCLSADSLFKSNCRHAAVWRMRPSSMPAPYRNRLCRMAVNGRHKYFLLDHCASLQLYHWPCRLYDCLYLVAHCMVTREAICARSTSHNLRGQPRCVNVQAHTVKLSFMARSASQGMHLFGDDGTVHCIGSPLLETTAIIDGIYWQWVQHARSLCHQTNTVRAAKVWIW